MLAASAVVHLPLAVMATLGYGPPMSSFLRALGLAAYLAIAAGAVLHRVDYRMRLGAAFIAGYLVIALANVEALNGPYARVGLVAVPILVLVLCGFTAARAATIASAVIAVSAPFLRALPGVARVLAVNPEQAGPSSLAWFHAIAFLAFLAALMIVLDRFHRFLLDALTSQAREMQERQALEREITEVANRERRRLGRELHDGVCQQIAAALLRCQGLKRRTEKGEAATTDDFTTLSSLLTDAMDDTHKVAVGLSPLQPEPDALATALRALATRTQEMAGVRCELRAAGDVRVADPIVAQHLYRIAQEALSNAARHAHASHIAVDLRGSDGELTLLVEDDGAGLPGELPAGGMGLRTMAYRARILDGELTISAAPSGGVRVFCRIPRSAGTPPTPQLWGEQRWIPA